MASIALKVDVDTYRGTREDVPRLLALLRERGLHATFLFSLGPDHTGRALKRVFRPGFLSKVARTSVASNYGLKTLMYGVLLPGPHIARKCVDVLRAARDAGHETGIHCWDHVYWQDYVAERDAAWTRRQFELAVHAFREAFGTEPRTHGAAGWQANAHLHALEDEYGFDYASDGRGRGPFVAVANGREFRCPQLPTTLPTLDELVGIDGATADDAIDALLARTPAGCDDQVFTLHAELEGRAYAPQFARLVDTWRDRGHRLVTTATMAQGLDVSRLPRCEVLRGEVAGRSGLLEVQGPALAPGKAANA
jgi:undecaprenyl phosphate-alpha-L-ara4FN deformylase